MTDPNSPNDRTRQTPPRQPEKVAGKTRTDESNKETSFSAGEGSPSNSPFLTNKVPTRVGQFEIRMLLGEGACGRVYLGFDATLGRQVAIKVPKPESLTPEFLDRFLREAQATATIHHPNVCPVYFVGKESDLPYIVMRYVAGGTLAGLLDSDHTPLTLQHKLAIIGKMAKGLAAAHAQKVIHRDLKPANVLYDKVEREVLITDFGLARIGTQARGTLEGAVFGTPAYMSPEQARGQVGVIGPLTDVYALGVILYEMLTGRVPFTGTVWEIMRQHCETTPHPPSVVRPSLDPKLDALCLKALAKNPADRYPSAQAFADAVAEYIRASRQGAVILDLPEAEPAPQPLRSSALPPIELARRRHHGGKIVAALMLLLAFGIGAAIVVKRQIGDSHDTSLVKPTGSDAPLIKNDFDQDAERKAVETILELKKEMASKSTSATVYVWVFDREKKAEVKVNSLAESLPAEFHIQQIAMYGLSQPIDGQLQKCFSGLSGPLKIKFGRINFLSDETLAVIARIPQLEELALDDTPRITDAGFAALSDHPSIKKLYLANLNLTSARLGRTLGALPVLTHLDLDKPLVTDELLAGLKKASLLTNLDCTASNSTRTSRLTRAGLESLGTFKNLSVLKLADHPIEDGWLRPLYSLKLKSINLRNTNITTAGRDALKKELGSECVVETSVEP